MGSEKFESLLELYGKEGRLSSLSIATLRDLYKSYVNAVVLNGYAAELGHKNLTHFVERLIALSHDPYTFPIYHQAIHSPFDYFRFGLDFLRPLIKMEQSTVQGKEHVDKIEEYLRNKENVIFLANHQAEPDATIINLMLEKGHPHLVKELIYVAGHRVVHDPLAIPLSMGCNLLCIWSKRHVENPPEQRGMKLEHNQRTIKTMQQLLNVGGKAIYVAPSGGRDRPDAEGRLNVAPFDASSAEMFLFCARHAARPTHIFPMALSTYNLMPPPDQVKKDLGEPRYTNASPVHINIGQELDVEKLIAESQGADRKAQREWRAKAIWEQVFSLYGNI